MEVSAEDDDDFEASAVRLLSSMRREITTTLETYAPRLSARPCSMHEVALFNSLSQLLQMTRSMSFSNSRSSNSIVDVQPSSTSTTTLMLTTPSEPKP